MPPAADLPGQVRFARLVWSLLLVCELLEINLVFKVHPQPIGNRPIEYGVYALSVWVVGVAVVLRRKLVKTSEKVLEHAPLDAIALKRWRLGQILPATFASAVTLFAVLVHLLSGSLSHSIPLFALGLAMMIYFFPRRP
jgi:hypothetical protein